MPYRIKVMNHDNQYQVIIYCANIKRLDDEQNNQKIDLATVDPAFFFAFVSF